MRLNFWQWLGLIVLITVGVYWIYTNFIAGVSAPTAVPAGT